MAIFSTDEVYQVAAQLEAAGREYYETIARETADEMIRKLCTRLARMEADHYRTFDQLRQQLASRPASRPLSWDEIGYAQAMIDNRVSLDLDDAARLAREGMLVEILKDAIQLEKDSILLYQEIRSAVDDADAAAIDEIIRQEKAHLVELFQVPQPAEG